MSYSLRVQPSIDVLSGLVLRDAISFLDHSLELIATTGDFIQIVVGEIAPLLLDAALQLLPVSFNTDPSP